ncbi:unnamed protein product [Arabis nemorensis]|uniref:Uncharacterized protein n=1 Tax=Arabis nemorensis TaxID=586526 RepID=A0A565C6N8_9BRAS|nr:unnamed protein product [Arabis nemorensis]
MSHVEEEDGEPLSPMARVFQSPGNNCCIVTMIGCKTKINADVILRALNHNVSKHPRFSSKLSNDGVSWIKTQVNVEDHVHVVDIDPKEIGEKGENFVEDYVSSLTMLPLDKSKPLWDIHILNVKTSDAEAVCVIRSHHSLGDGTSLMSLLVACTQKTSVLDTFPSIPVHKPRKIVHREKGSWFLRSILAIFSSARLIWNTLVDILLALAIILFLKDTKTPLKGDVGVESNPNKFCHRIVSLDDIKNIKEVMNMTINDVLLGVTQAALSRYLSNFPGKIRLTAGVFVNLRPYTGIQVGAILLARAASNTTTSISNMVGPMEEISFHGHEIAYIAPSVYGHAHALTIHFLSYADKMVISIGVDTKVVPNPHKLCDEMEDSLKAMKAAILERELL